MADQEVKVELKQKLPSQEFVNLLRQCLDALESDEQRELMISNQECIIPAHILSKAKFEVEYEIKDEETELEFTIKWE